MRIDSVVSLLAYTAGFAAIAVGGVLQQHKLFNTDPSMALLTVVCAQALLWGMLLILRSAWRLRPMDCRGEESKEALWESESRQAEITVASLSASFMLVQVLRFAISGVLPGKGGIEQPERPHSVSCILTLYAAGLCAFAASILFYHVLRRTSTKNSKSIAVELGRTLQHTASMMFAWSMIFATRWLALRISQLKKWQVAPGTVAWQVIQAIAMSGLATALTSLLHGVDRRLERKDPTVHALIHCAVSDLILLVALSWEMSFDLAVKQVCHSSSRPRLMEISISAVVVLLVVPSWRMYIVTKAYYARRAWHQEQMDRQGAQDAGRRIAAMASGTSNSTGDDSMFFGE